MYFISPHSGSRPSHLLQLQRYSCSRKRYVAGVAVEGFTTPLLELIFQRRELLFLWEVNEEDSRADCTSLASGQAFPISYSAFPLLDCVISEYICSGGLHHYFGG